ncbi:MAG: glycosyltransferase family 2 protein [Candidatus Xenobiia bacterium LiM19]
MDKSADTPLLVSIIIPYFRGFDELSVCLTSLKRNLEGITHEVIVIENGSGDESASWIARDFPWVTVIVNEENRFFSGAMNQGFSSAKGRYLFALNSDTEIVGDVLQKMLEFMEKPEHTHVGICTCAIYQMDGNPQQLDRYAVGILTFIIRFILLEKRILQVLAPWLHRRLFNAVYYRDERNMPEAREVLNGQALLIRREIIEKLGGFDERYRLWFTDDEFCHRIRAGGYQLLYLPCERIIHRHSSSIKRLSGAQRIIDDDTALYLKERFGWPGFIICYPLYKCDRIMRRLVQRVPAVLRRNR